MKYSRVLLEHCPVDTTALFIDYFTGKFKPKQASVVLPVADNVASQPGYVMGAAMGTVNAVQNLRDLLPLPYMNNSGISSPAVQETGSIPANNEQLPNVAESISPAEYITPPPRNAFSSFVDHADEFITFLEACLKQKPSNPTDEADLYTTLFEMYLHKAGEKRGIDREDWEAKAKGLIDSNNMPIDTSNMLLLSHLSNFRDGTTMVREQAGLRFDIFRSFTSAKDTRGAIKALRKYGPLEPQLYPAALAYFTSDARVLEDAGDELAAVLDKINADGLMAPLQVIQTLSTNAVATMGMIKPYLQQTIERERKELSTNRRLIASYRDETSIKRQEIVDLAEKPQTFNNSRCSDCGTQLHLPVIHFLCKHSFHKKCLNVKVVTDADGEETVEGDCPVCKRDNETIRAMRRAQLENAEKSDIYRDALARSDDRFKTVSEFFGRGVMSVGSLVD